MLRIIHAKLGYSALNCNLFFKPIIETSRKWLLSGQQFFAALRPFEAGRQSWYWLIVCVSFLTTFIIWQNADYTFSEASVRHIWQARQKPFNAFQWLLAPFAHGGEWAWFFFIALLHIYIALAFAWVGEKIGIGRINLGLLLLLLNFTLEYNDFRLEMNPQLVYACLWLTAVTFFLAMQEHSLIKAFIAWAAWMWFAALFSAQAVIWTLGFPLLFLAWPRHERWNWRRPFGDREKFLLIYYALVFFLIALVPDWRDGVINVVRLMQFQFSRATLEISLYMSTDQGMSLSTISAVLIAMLLIAYKTLLIAGLPLAALLCLSMRAGTASVLNGRVRLFFWFAVCFFWLLNAVNLLYQGRIHSDIFYIPVLLLLLWLSSNGAYALIQQWRQPSRKPERRLIALWLLVAYALASMIQFAPSMGHRREAGLFARAQAAPIVYANSPQSLFYAGYSPMPASVDYLEFDTLKYAPRQYLGDKGLYLYSLSRHAQMPPELKDNFQIAAEFANRRGDRSFVLQAK